MKVDFLEFCGSIFHRPDAHSRTLKYDYAQNNSCGGFIHYGLVSCHCQSVPKQRFLQIVRHFSFPKATLKQNVTEVGVTNCVVGVRVSVKHMSFCLEYR